MFFRYRRKLKIRPYFLKMALPSNRYCFLPHSHPSRCCWLYSWYGFRFEDLQAIQVQLLVHFGHLYQSSDGVGLFQRPECMSPWHEQWSLLLIWRTMFLSYLGTSIIACFCPFFLVEFPLPSFILRASLLCLSQIIARPEG